MELKEILKFVQIDESFYSVLKEYEKTKNAKLVLEKIKERFFWDYKTIGKLSNGFQDKKSLDFFVGSKPADIYKGLKSRIEHDMELPPLNAFVMNLLFESAYSNTKKYEIVQELVRFLKKSTNAYSGAQKENTYAMQIVHNIKLRVLADMKQPEIKFDMGSLKYVELLKPYMSSKEVVDVMRRVLDEADFCLKDKVKSRKKLIAARNFLDIGFVEAGSGHLVYDMKDRLAKFFLVMTKEIKEETKEFGSSRKFVYEYSDLMSLLTELYKGSLSDEIYKLVFVPLLDEKEIPDVVYKNLHLIKNTQFYKDYILKSAKESLHAVAYYKEVYPDLKSLDREGKTNREVTEMLVELSKKWGGKYDLVGGVGSGAMQLRLKYPMSLKRGSYLNDFWSALGGVVAKEHEMDILSLDYTYFSDIVSSGRDDHYFIKMVNLIQTRGFTTDETKKHMVTFLRNGLDLGDFMLPQDRLEDIYVTIINNIGLFEYLKRTKYQNENPLCVNNETVTYGRRLKAYNEAKFRSLLIAAMAPEYKKLSRELFLTYYSFSDLKDFGSFAVEYFVEDKESFHKIVALKGGDIDEDFMVSLVRISKPFYGEVLEDLIKICEGNVSVMERLLKGVMTECPHLSILIKDWKYKNPRVKDAVFNAYMVNLENNRDQKALPYNVSVVDNDKRLEALSILERAIGDLFSVSDS